MKKLSKKNNDDKKKWIISNVLQIWEQKEMPKKLKSKMLLCYTNKKRLNKLNILVNKINQNNINNKWESNKKTILKWSNKNDNNRYKEQK